MTDEYQIDGKTWAEKDASGNISANVDSVNTDKVNTTVSVKGEAELRDALENADPWDKIEVDGNITVTTPITCTQFGVELTQNKGVVTVDVGTGNDGITFDGSSSALFGLTVALNDVNVNSGRDGVRFDTCVRDCVFRDAQGRHDGDSDGFVFRAVDSWGISVKDVSPANGSGGGGIKIVDGHKALVENVLAKNMSGDGIVVQNSAAPTILSCDGEFCGGSGIVVDQCTGADVIGPYTESNTGYGLKLTGESTNRPFEVSVQGGRHKDNNGGGKQVFVGAIRDSDIGRFHFSGGGALEISSDAVRVVYHIRDGSAVTDNGTECARLGYDSQTKRYTVTSDIFQDSQYGGFVTRDTQASDDLYRIRVTNGSIEVQGPL